MKTTGTVAAEQLQDFEAVQLRHLHVQEQQVWRTARLTAFTASKPLAQSATIVTSGKPIDILADDGARQRLVVDNYDA